jgi:3-oxoacyl-[acyl-carrier protein] reductase
MDLALNGRTALVSGSHRGTGAIIAARLAAEGARVIVHGLEPGQAEAAVRELGCGTAVTGDLTTDAGADAVFAACSGAVVDILINNYGAASQGN